MRHRRRYRERFSRDRFSEQDNKRKLSLIPLLFASVFFVIGTYAWFVYYSNVESSMTGHVVGWKIDFDDQDTSTDFSVDVAKIYPGMEDFESSLLITNSGETDATITSLIKSVTILDTTYTVGDEVGGKVLSSEDISQIIEETYPFTFGYAVDDEILKPGKSTYFKVKILWPYESFKKVGEKDYYNELRDYYILQGDKYILFPVADRNMFLAAKENLYYTNDLLDTKWGERANTYVQENPDTPCISLILQVDAVQYIEE